MESWHIPHMISIFALKRANALCHLACSLEWAPTSCLYSFRELSFFPKGGLKIKTEPDQLKEGQYFMSHKYMHNSFQVTSDSRIWRDSQIKFWLKIGFVEMVFWAKSHFHMMQTLARKAGMAGSSCGMSLYYQEALSKKMLQRCSLWEVSGVKWTRTGQNPVRYVKSYSVCLQGCKNKFAYLSSAKVGHFFCLLANESYFHSIYFTTALEM